MPADVEIRITLIARNANGNIANIKEWADNLDQEIRTALADGPDLDVTELKIEQKRSGFETLASYSRGRP